MKSRSHLFAVSVAVVLALAACSGGGNGEGSGAEGEGDRTLRVRIPSDVVSLHPHERSTIENTSVQVHLYDALLTYDYETMELLPQLATDWEASDDGKTFTFNLDPDATFHDGTPVTADDVVYSYERVMDPTVASPHAFAFSLVESVDAVNDTTVVISLSEPDANFLHYVAQQAQALILPRDASEEMGDDFGQSPIGSGPYRLGEWTPGQGVTLERYEDYYGPEPGFDTLEFTLIPEETVAETALKNGEIDVLWALADPLAIERLRAEEGVTVQETQSLLTCYVALDTRKAPFDDVRVRQAAAYGMDMRALVEDYFEGTKAMPVTPLTPQHAEFTDDVPTYEYDPERAKELLQEAGYAEGEAPFDFWTLALNPHDDYPVLLVDALSAAGFDSSLNVMERAEFGTARSAGELPTALGCPPNGVHPDVTLRQVFHSENTPPGWNVSYYDGVDDLLDEARTETNDDRRLELYAEVQRKIMEDVPVIPMFTDILYQAHNSDVEDLSIPPMWVFDSRGSSPAGS